MTSPIEGALAWSIQKRRREEGGFPGAARIQKQLSGDMSRLRVGFAFEGRAPAREGAEVALADGTIIGRITSGGFGPSLNAPCAMGYVDKAHASIGANVNVLVRGRALAATIVKMPFVPNRFKR
jgi:aminomethyltransferase